MSVGFFFITEDRYGCHIGLDLIHEKDSVNTYEFLFGFLYTLFFLSLVIARLILYFFIILYFWVA